MLGTAPSPGGWGNFLGGGKKFAGCGPAHRRDLCGAAASDARAVAVQGGCPAGTGHARWGSVSTQASILAAFVAFNLTLIIVLRIRPAITAATGGKALAFLALFVLPAMTFAGSMAHHLDQATTTEFCVSCHVMEPYGRSLEIDSRDHLPANHFQNHRVPPDQACYTCHTTYAMFGDLQAKLNGVRHVAVNYLGSVSEPIALYQPYQNRECLHCHAAARTFEEQPFHSDIRQDLARDEVSCLTCHAVSHDIAALDTLPRWTPPASDSEHAR